MRTEGRWSQDEWVSAPLRVPRPGPNVGKVAHCFSHDPWEEAFFPLGPWMEKRRHRKTQERDTPIGTCYGCHRVCLMFTCTQQSQWDVSVITARNYYINANVSNTRKDNKATCHRTSYVSPLSLSHSLSRVRTKNMNVCVNLKIVVSQRMWGRSCNSSNLQWLAWTWSLEVNAAFKMQLILQCSTFFNHSIKPANVTLIKVI